LLKKIAENTQENLQRNKSGPVLFLNVYFV